MGEFPNKDTQFKPGNPGGPGRPKGWRPLSHWIQDMLNDESFELFLEHPIEGFKKFEGAPAKAIVQTAVKRAAAGDQRWADWLAKYGESQKIDVTSNGQTLATVSELSDEELDERIARHLARRKSK